MPVVPFRTQILQPGNSAPWMRDGTGERLSYTFGLMADARLERLVQGIKCRLPRSQYGAWQAPDDALALIGANRGPITRGPTESSSSYALRLQKAADEWQIWGSPRSVLDQVCAYFSPQAMTAKIITDSGHWYTMSTTGVLGAANTYTVLAPAARYPAIASNWSWDGASKWWRCWLIIHLPVGYTTVPVYDSSGAFDSGLVYDGVAAGALSQLQTIAVQWLPAHVAFGGIIFTTLQPTDSIPGFGGRHPFDPADVAINPLADGSTSLPVGNWGGVVWGTNFPSRPPWASFYGTKP